MDLAYLVIVYQMASECCPCFEKISASLLEHKHEDKIDYFFFPAFFLFTNSLHWHTKILNSYFFSNLNLKLEASENYKLFYMNGEKSEILDQFIA